MSGESEQPARVLVVDDEPSICECLALALRAQHLEVTSATTAAEALELARRARPDLVIADLRLGADDGLELIDRLRELIGDIPAVIITGHGDAEILSEASRRRPVEMLNKPLDLERLRRTVAGELQRRREGSLRRRREQLRRRAVLRAGRKHRHAYRALCSACAEMTAQCRDLQARLGRQEALIRYQTELLACADEDDVFRCFFRLFVQRSGPVFGVAMLADAGGGLQMVGRFGVPSPDGVRFCRTLGRSAADVVVVRPEVVRLDALENPEMFPAGIHRLLVGLTLMIVPLPVGDGRIVGACVLYRKGEQPFTDDDAAMAEMVAAPTAAAVQRV